MQELRPGMLPKNGALVVRDFLDPSAITIINEDYAIHQPAYDGYFVNVERPRKNTDIVHAPGGRPPEALVELAGNLYNAATALGARALNVHFDSLIDGLPQSTPHKDDLHQPAISFIVVVDGQMICEYVGMIYVESILKNIKSIRKGQSTVITAGDVVILDNSSNFREKRPPHATSQGGDCLRIAADVNLPRFKSRV